MKCYKLRLVTESVLRLRAAMERWSDCASIGLPWHVIGRSIEHLLTKISTNSTSANFAAPPLSVFPFAHPAPP